MLNLEKNIVFKAKNNRSYLYLIFYQNIIKSLKIATMKFDVITKEKHSEKKPSIFGNNVLLFILGEIDGFNAKKLEKMRRKCYKTEYRGEFGDNWLDIDKNYKILDEDKSKYYYEIKEIETRSYENKLRFRAFINFQPDVGRIKKKIRTQTIFTDGDDIISDLVYNGGFFRCDINMNDTDTKFFKEEINLIELHLHNEADNINNYIIKNKEELNSQILKNIPLIK